MPMHHTCPYFCVVLYCALLATGWDRLAQAQPYTVTEFGQFNARAVALPYVVGDEAGRPVRMDLRTGAKQVLPDRGHGGMANAVLPSGVAVGSIQDVFQGTIQETAAFWDEAGTLFLLNGLVPQEATAINEAWTTAGVGDCDGQQTPKRWFPTLETDECLGTAPMQGVVRIDGGDFVWTTANGRVIVYGLNGTVFDRGPGHFRGVNKGGLATMTITGSDIQTSVYRGSLTTSWQPLPNLMDVEFGRPFLVCESRAVNRQGEIVGGCARSQNLVYATMWTAAGEAVNLNDLADLPRSAEQVAVAIDEAGLILVNLLPAGSPPGPRRTVLLTPGPQPVLLQE